MLRAVSAGSASRTLWSVGALLFCSGFCALVFQVVWIRELRLLFGGTTAAGATTLAVFMGGLGLGNAFIGRRGDWWTRPLRNYGWLECGISLSALLSLVTLPLLSAGYLRLGGQTALGGTGATVARLLISLLVLGVPTFLMGGTLPAAARAVAADSDERRRNVAVVYALNTLGAVAGVALTSLVLLESLGNTLTITLAAAVNLVIGLLAIRLGGRQTELLPAPPAPAPVAVDGQRGVSAPLLVLCGFSFVLGFSFFLMELIWYRIVGPLLGGTTYAFGFILVMALLGIGAGGAVYAACSRWVKPSFLLLAITCLLEAGSLAYPFWRADQLALDLFQASQEIDSFGAQIRLWARFSGVTIFPAALVSGFQFPLLLAVAGRGVAGVSRQVGWLFAANTLGAIAGSLGGGFLLLPLLGGPQLWLGVIVGLLASSLLLLAAGRPRPVWASVVTAAACLPLLLTTWLSTGPTAAYRHSGIGAGRAAGPETYGQRDVTHWRQLRRGAVVWEAEGVESSIAVTADDSLALIVNGKSDGNAVNDAGTQIGLGLLGPLLHPQGSSAVVVGLGTGETAGWLADCRSLERVVVVELEPAVVQMAELCAPVNRDVLKNPKVELVHNDAREYLLTADQPVDFIISEPSNPYRAGIATLFTREFYEAARSRLNERGLFIQWLQAYEVDERTISIVFRTLREVFPEVTVWQTQRGDSVLVCSREPLLTDPAELESALIDPVLAAGLKYAWQTTDREGVLAHYVAGTTTVEGFVVRHPAPVNTDDANALEYAFARSVGRRRGIVTQQVRELAREREDDLPPALREALDRDRLERRRLAVAVQSLSLTPDANHLPANSRNLHAALLAYLQDDVPGCVQRLDQEEVTLLAECPILSRVYALSLARLGREVPAPLLASIEQISPTDARIIQAVAHVSRNEFTQAAEDSQQALELLLSDPWGHPDLLGTLFNFALELSKAKPERAARFFAAMEQPFAMHRMELRRKFARYLLAEQLDDEQVIAALAELEPHVPWKSYLLRKRAAVYARAGHPLTEQARRELDRYLQQD